MGLMWRSFSFAILSCIYNCRDRVWHKNNCQPALDGQLGSSLFSKEAPTHQLNALSAVKLQSHDKRACQTDRLKKLNSVNMDRNVLCLEAPQLYYIVDKPIFHSEPILSSPFCDITLANLRVAKQTAHSAANWAFKPSGYLCAVDFISLYHIWTANRVRYNIW